MSPVPSDPRARLRLVVGRPRWAVVSLAGIVVGSALLFTWNIGYSGLSTYYAASAASMSTSWHDLVVGALNRSATITLDKLSGFLVPQALMIRLFGVHAWALSLPQAVEGVVTVVAAYALGVRWRGPAVGVAAALATALTPMLAAMFGRPMEDGMLTMAVALAMVAAQRAMLTGRVLWLLPAAAWVAVAFQAKMLQAWFVVPAVLLMYAVGASGPVRRRVAAVLVAGVVTALLSISWISVIQLIPDRPYADGTTNGNFFSMVFGYNGIDRLVPGAIPGSVPQLGVGGGQTGAPAAPHAALPDAQHSPIKMLLPEIATQIGWLYPLALAGALWELITVVPFLRSRLPAVVASATPRDRVDRGMVVGLLLWVGVTALLLAPAHVPHATYFAMIGVPIALLAIVGGGAALRLLRDDVRGWRWAAPALVAVAAAWDALTILAGPPSLAPVGVVVLAAGAVALVLLVLRLRGGGARTLRAAAIATVLTAGIAPVVWTSSVLLPGGGGSASDAYAGPRIPRPVAGPATAVLRTASRPAGLRPPFAIPADPELTPAQRGLAAYVVAHTGAGRPLFATDTLAIAVSYLLESPYDAVPMGGFSRQAPTPTLTQLQGDLRDGTIRYVLLADDTAAPPPPNPAVEADRAWVRSSCTAVLHGRYRDGSPEQQTLYDCAVR